MINSPEQQTPTSVVNPLNLNQNYPPVIQTSSLVVEYKKTIVLFGFSITLFNKTFEFEYRLKW